MTSPRRTVSVTIVTYNSAQWLQQCLDAVFAQERVATEVIVVDNASTDETALIACRYPRAAFLQLDRNVGYCAAQNLAIERTTGEFVATVNADVVLRSDYLSTLAQVLTADTRLGSITGVLYAMKAVPDDIWPRVLDHAGFFPMRSGSVWDWGQGELDGANWRRSLAVFGVSGAAAIYRRVALADVAVGGQVMCESLFAYADDVDLAWRLQLRGWQSSCVGSAVGWHARAVPTDGPRRSRAPLVNYHLTRNRYQVWIQNWPLRVAIRNLSHLVLWLIAALAYHLAFERRSLRALAALYMDRRDVLAWRATVTSRMRVDTATVFEWFAATDRLRRARGLRSWHAVVTRLRRLFVDTAAGAE